MTNRTGRCLCGAIKYTLTAEPAMTAVCHCTHCQRQSGAVFSTNMIIAEKDYVQTGETKVYDDTGDSGNPVWRHFCGTCGSPLYSKIGAMPGMIAVKVGTLDDFAGLSPAIEVYTDHAAPWSTAVPGAQRFARGAG